MWVYTLVRVWHVHGRDAGAGDGGVVVAVVDAAAARGDPTKGVVVAGAACTGAAAVLNLSRRCGHDADFRGVSPGECTPDARWQRKPPSRIILVFEMYVCAW